VLGKATGGRKRMELLDNMMEGRDYSEAKASVPGASNKLGE